MKLYEQYLRYLQEEITINLPPMVQSNSIDCGPTILQSILSYYGIEVKEDQLSKQLNTNKNGTSIDNMISVSKGYGFKVEAKENLTIDDLINYLKEGYPIIVLLQAWPEKTMTISKWNDSWSNGHYAAVIGYSNDKIIFEDPFSFKRTWLSTKEFIIRWHDLNKQTGKKYKQFGMVLKGKEPVKQIIDKSIEHMD